MSSSSDIAEPTGFIRSPTYDRLWIIYSPLWSLGLAAVIFGVCYGISLAGPLFHVTAMQIESFITGALIGVVIQAHLVLVLLRSHLNPFILGTFKKRLLVIPLLATVVQLVSPLILVCAFVLTVFWDVYHSAMQTFGFGRIYDLRSGNDPEAVRRTDILFNLNAYITPIFIGLCAMEHFGSFWKFVSVGVAELAVLPYKIQPYMERARAVALFVWCFIMVVCLIRYRQHRSEGYRFPLLKRKLFLVTATVSFVAWGLLPPIYAFFIVNLFHAVQYFAIVWWSESNRLEQIKVMGRQYGRPLILATILVVTLVYGIVSERTDEGWGLALINTVTLVHFWADGFIWSVRRGHIG